MPPTLATGLVRGATALAHRCGSTPWSPQPIAALCNAGVLHSRRTRRLVFLRGFALPSQKFQWAGLENADFWATDLGSAVSNVVLRIVGQSVACASLGH